MEEIVTQQRIADKNILLRHQYASTLDQHDVTFLYTKQSQGLVFPTRPLSAQYRDRYGIIEFIIKHPTIREVSVCTGYYINREFNDTDTEFGREETYVRIRDATVAPVLHTENEIWKMSMGVAILLRKYPVKLRHTACMIEIGFQSKEHVQFHSLIMSTETNAAAYMYINRE